VLRCVALCCRHTFSSAREFGEPLWRLSVRCSVLQCVAVCCSVLQVLRYVAVCCSVLQTHLLQRWRVWKATSRPLRPLQNVVAVCLLLLIATLWHVDVTHSYVRHDGETLHIRATVLFGETMLFHGDIGLFWGDIYDIWTSLTHLSNTAKETYT